MKKGISLIVLIFAILFLVACGSSTVDVSTTLNGMVCVSCEADVTNILDGLGVEVLAVSAASDYLHFEYDPDDISLAEIMSALRENGFTMN